MAENGTGAELTADEREALRDFVIRALAAAARLYTMTQEDGQLTRAAAVLELTRVQRHAEAGAALLRPGPPRPGNHAHEWPSKQDPARDLVPGETEQCPRCGLLRHKIPGAGLTYFVPAGDGHG